MRLARTNLDLLPRSLASKDDLECGFVRVHDARQLVILGRNIPEAFVGENHENGERTLRLCPLSPANAEALRALFDWLKPRPLGLTPSIGMGDRLGLATPGHVRALRATGCQVAPVFAQQSIRELARTRRTPQQVMDAATWGMFEEGWQLGAGADADHLKTPADIDACLAAGFTLFTIDPGAYVENAAEAASFSRLRELAALLPSELRPEASGLAGRRFDVEGLTLVFDEPALLKAAVKYGRAVAHVASMYRHLQGAAGPLPFELEVSVDETDEPTSHLEHVYIASELRRLGVQWISLAPRYVGRFDKGVDYIGDLEAFERDFAGHAAIARALGSYKLSLHSGSDKFSIYPVVARLTHGLVHLKTAGTSYLEALRTIAQLDPALLREVYEFSLDCYERDRSSYHVSAERARAPLPDAVKDWPELLDDFHARQILHVAFGSVLTDGDAPGRSRFYDRLMHQLRSAPEAYAANLEKHFIRHLQPFSNQE